MSSAWEAPQGTELGRSVAVLVKVHGPVGFVATLPWTVLLTLNRRLASLWPMNQDLRLGFGILTAFGLSFLSVVALVEAVRPGREEARTGPSLVVGTVLGVIAFGLGGSLTVASAAVLTGTSSVDPWVLGVPTLAAGVLSPVPALVAAIVAPMLAGKQG